MVPEDTTPIGEPLKPGDTGEGVRDLHRRLDTAGLPVAASEVTAGHYGDDTAARVARFQAERGLHEHGLVDEHTLSSLIEAGHRLGDRNLYLHAPMLRGDDVADLQLRLGSLGFDAGRIDGIFGPDTSAALRDFQHNSGLVLDGIAGADTVRSLRQLVGRSAGTTPVAQVRELDRLRRSRPDLDERRIALGQFGSCGALAGALSRGLRTRGANVVALDHPDDTTQAATANRFEAEAYLGLRIENLPTPEVAHFATEGFHSEGGLRLAQHCAAALKRVLADGMVGTEVAVRGMRIPILRRTRMPAVLCTLAPPSSVVPATAELAEQLTAAVSDWAADPTASPGA
ncbi:MAG: peptidoglycan-binding protein [Acidimicrobiales bacterium]|nr:peptidoglycan-binding protein [Acidimicrobiales bacterium]